MTDGTLRVWAPDATTVSAEIDGASEGLARDPNSRGWWISKRAVAVGADYSFRVDGGDPRPDPRSRWQPAGVNGQSRALDPLGFTWTDDDWRPRPLGEALIYEAHIGTFSDALMAEAKEKKWTVISMKDDWKKIFAFEDR